MERRRVVIDVDVGTDDYLAILLFLHAEKLGEIKIEAFICSMGNTTADYVCKNLIRLLEIVGRTDIPVYKGASKQLIPPTEVIPIFHGTDGFSDLDYDKNPDVSIIKKEPAASALRNVILQYPNEISLICVAPLTNIALAIRLDNDITKNIKDIWIMGGNYTAVGNVTAAAEFNFYADPEAAFIVLESIEKPIYLLTWETCLKTNLTFDWRYNVFTLRTSPELNLLHKAEKKLYGDTDDNWWPCDAFVAAAFLYSDEIIVKTSTHFASIELHGSQTRGQVVLDHTKKKKPNVTLIEKIDDKKFLDFLLKL